MSQHATIDQFLLVCEKLIYRWQQVQFQYDFRNDKRATSPADLSRDRKKTKSSQPPKAAPMATEVGEHCEGCGKRNHLRQDCTSGHAPKHPDFNEEGKWIGFATYKTIKAWLASNDRACEHPTLRFNYRADGTPMVLKPKTKPNRPSDRDYRSNQIGVGPTIKRETVSEKSGAPCTSESRRRLAQEEVRVSCRPQ